MDINDKDRIQSMSLDQKVEQSKKIIREALDRFGHERLAIAWTGGKDSTTMLWLFKEVCRERSYPIPKCMFIDEGDVFDQIWEVVNRLKSEWNVNVIVNKNTDISGKANRLGDVIRARDLNDRNKRELAAIKFSEAEFAFEPESYVGNHLMKTVPMKLFIENNQIQALATAIRWDEQDARVKETYFSPRTNPEHIRVHPILHFTERDIWNNIQKNKIPFCSLYHQGYRSLGARCSTRKFSEIPAWEQDLEKTTERGGRGADKEAIMGQLRALGYM